MTKAQRAVASPRVVNIEDLRSLARARLPKIVFDYLDGGAEDEVTLQANRRAFDAVTFRLQDFGCEELAWLVLDKIPGKLWEPLWGSKWREDAG